MKRTSQQLILDHYDAIPILLDFLKECAASNDGQLSQRAREALDRWDTARNRERKAA